MATVIGFLSYEDFCAELEQAPPGVVRLQDYYQRESNRAGLEWATFLVEAAAVQDGMVLACRCKIGGGMVYENEERKRDQENSNAAMKLLTDDLTQRGFDVRPGVIAAAKKSETTATCRLWRFEDKTLVANDEADQKQDADGAE